MTVQVASNTFKKCYNISVPNGLETLFCEFLICVYNIFTKHSLKHVRVFAANVFINVLKQI